MTDGSDAHAVLIVGIYGTGKTSVVEEIADILEDRGVRYAAIDLDWLWWFDPGAGGRSAAAAVWLNNLAAVVGNYYGTDVRRFAIAGMVESSAEVDELAAALGMPTTVVRLTLPLDEIERRLASYVTAGRRDDLEVAMRASADCARMYGQFDGVRPPLRVQMRRQLFVAEYVEVTMAARAWPY